jgi:hypothetical protein
MIPVYIKDTPITYTIPFSKISLERRSGFYVPGGIINHDVFGKIRCEEIQFGQDLKPFKVVCSIVDEKSIK